MTANVEVKALEASGFFLEGTGGGCDAYIKRVGFAVFTEDGADWECEILITDGDLNIPESYPCEIGAVLTRDGDFVEGLNWAMVNNITEVIAYAENVIGYSGAYINEGVK